MISKINSLTNFVKEKTKKTYRKITTIVERRPLVSFFSFLVLLLLLIIASNFINSPKKEVKKESAPAKSVNVYSIGEAPKVTLQGQVEKSGVVVISALSGGIVNQINVTEGQTVVKGTNLIWMTTNYQGSNIFSLQRQLAAQQYNNVNDSYPIQKDLISKQRDVANKSAENTDELRKISDASLGETRDLLLLNENILSTLDTNIKNLESANTGGANDAAILGAKQMKSQFQSAVNQLRSAVRNLEYQTDTDNPPTELANLQKDMTLKQLDLQEKALDLSREVSRIQLQIAQANESLMHPVTPFAGIIQRIHVRIGQSVAPGTPLVTLSGAKGQGTIVVNGPKDIISKLSLYDQSTLYIGDTKLYARPYFISSEATQGTLYTAYYQVPETHYKMVTDKGYVKIEAPIGYPNTGSVVPFIPMDAVYQSEDRSYVFVIKKGRAQVKTLLLGPVYGRYVTVESGLNTGDAVILDRTVLEGDKVKAL